MENRKLPNDLSLNDQAIKSLVALIMMEMSKLKLPNELNDQLKLMIVVKRTPLVLNGFYWYGL